MGLQRIAPAPKIFEGGKHINYIFKSYSTFRKIEWLEFLARKEGLKITYNPEFSYSQPLNFPGPPAEVF